MIRIKKLRIENYKGFSDATIEFGNHITCIAGINGSGKSSCLEALAKSIHALLRPIVNPKLKNVIFEDVKEADINVNSENKCASLSLDFDCGGNNLSQKIDTEGHISRDFEIEEIARSLKKEFTVASYYPVNRSELDIDVSVETEKDLSEKKESLAGAMAAVTHYKEFFKWFRDREDRENQEIVSRYKRQSKEAEYEDYALKAVRTAISTLLPGFSQMAVERKKLSIVVNKENSVLDFSNLSDGEKGIITLFGDIARRLAIANENLENPLEGNGIILIDEIDLHLHPSWQRKICHALVQTFPNCQFVVTTHSPQILGELKTDEIWLLNDFNVYRPDSSFGLTSDQILDEVMDVIDGDFTLSRDSTVAKRIKDLNLAMETEQFAEAKKIISELETATGTKLHETESCKIALEMMESEQ